MFFFNCFQFILPYVVRRCDNRILKGVFVVISEIINAKDWNVFVRSNL